MKFKLIALLSLVFAFGNAHATDGNGYGNFISLRDDVVSLIELSQKALVDYNSVKDKTQNELPLNGAELNLIHEGVLSMKDPSDRLIEYVMDQITTLKFDETAEMGEDEMRKLTRTLGVSLTILDCYLQYIAAFEGDATLRHIVNEGNSVPGKPKNKLKEFLVQDLKARNIRHLGNGIKFFSLYHDQIFAKGEQDEEFKFWGVAIENSFLFAELKKQNISLVKINEPRNRELIKVVKKLINDTRGGTDVFYYMGQSLVEALSKSFGNVMGLVQFRHGYLKDRADVIADMKAHLKPLDVLFEKTPFRLTDHFIPGYWGHNAIWLGTEAELKELGLWDHPVIQPLQEQIRAGNSIVEALRPGTVVDPIEHFLDIDDLAVIRMKKISTDELKKNLIVAASQYGKPYDFNFDVATQNRLVCSELIFMSYLDINFKTERAMGRYTINPDSVAERARPENEFNVVLLYTGGKKVEGNLEAKMAYILDHSNRKDKNLLKDFQKIR